MKQLTRTSHPVTMVLAFLTICGVASAQMFGQSLGPDSAPPQSASRILPPTPVTKANTANPQPAQQAILALFDKYEVVAMGAAHGEKDLDDFTLALIRNPEFPDKANDIAVECGNSLYQPILDRYIADENVPLSDVQQVWRNIAQPGCSFSTFYEELFPLVREINKRLPPNKKLRMLAGDPSIDLSKDTGPSMGRISRDENIAFVMEKEVLLKHRKALMLFGLAHLIHGTPHSAVGIYEKDYPNVTYVIHEHFGFCIVSSPACRYNDELEKRMASWPVPSLVAIKGSWLGELSPGYSPLAPERALPSMADGYLYLGPGGLLLFEHTAANIVMDKDYMAQLQLRYDGHIEEELGTEGANATLYQEALAIISSRPGGSSGGVKGKALPHEASVEAAADVGGTWHGSFTNSRGDKRDLTFNLKRDGDKVTGTISGGPPMGEEQPITNGRIEGNQLSWELHATVPAGNKLSSKGRGGNDLLFKYRATVNGNQIEGTITSSQEETAPFSATREQQGKK